MTLLRHWLGGVLLKLSFLTMRLAVLVFGGRVEYLDSLTEDHE